MAAMRSRRWVAVAATLAVAYPHMTGIGWRRLLADRRARCAGCTRSTAAAARAAAADLALYEGLDAVPTRGPLAANTVAGTISVGPRCSMGRRATCRCRDCCATRSRSPRTGVAVTAGGAAIAAARSDELRELPGAYAAIYEPAGRPLREGERLRQPALAESLRTLAEDGLDGFYSGALGDRIAEDLADLGSPVSRDDPCRPLREPARAAVGTDRGRAAVQFGGRRHKGFASLMILALFDRLRAEVPDNFAHIHALVEATKRAFVLRDEHVGRSGVSRLRPAGAARRWRGARPDGGRDRSRPRVAWPQPAAAGDTCWFAAADGEGRVASAIQSTYFEFGAGLVLPRTGITWQNRGSSFRLARSGWNALAPGRKPFHTLNRRWRGSTTAGRWRTARWAARGQPQTQAAIFSRYARFGIGLQARDKCTALAARAHLGRAIDDVEAGGRIRAARVRSACRGGP